MREREYTKYDAQGVNERRHRGYGVIVWVVDPPEEYYAEPGKLVMKTTPCQFFRPSGEGPFPHSIYFVLRRDFNVYGSLLGNQEYLRERLDSVLVPMKVRNDILHILYDHPTWVIEDVVSLLLRIETYDLHVKLSDDEEEEKDEEEEDEEEDNVSDNALPSDNEDDFVEFENYEEFEENPAYENAVWELERLSIKGEDDDCEDGDEEMSKSCAICLEGYSIGMEVTKMSCSHVFHNDFIVSWLERQCFCPLCRFKLVSEFEFDTSCGMIGIF